MTKKTRYESRVFDGRIIHSAEIERIHKEVLDFERIEAISDPNARADRGPVAGAGEQAPTEGHLTPIATSILGQGRLWSNFRSLLESRLKSCGPRAARR